MAGRSEVKEITAKLEENMKDLFESDKYAEYLKTMSRFHNYSTKNTLLIFSQLPNASLVTGFKGWITKFGRHVKKGEKAIKILAPIPYVIKEESEKLDPETKRPVLDENGMPIIEENERRFARFKVVSVFDISQTIGKPLPSLVNDISGNVEHYEAFMDALRAVSPLPIVFEPLPENNDGLCIYGDKIIIREGMSEIQTVCAALHEITHAKLDDVSIIAENEDIKPRDKNSEEIIAESVAYSISQYFGIETSANSLGYIAEYSKSRDLKELNASLDTIRKTASELIDSIEEKYRTIAKERGIDLSAVAEEQAAEIIEPSEHTPVTSAEQPVKADIIAEYAENTKTATPPKVGSTVLMTPLFEDGNLNRNGKKIRVKVEEPAGKYQLFSREEFGHDTLYFLTASERIVRTDEYFRNVWDEEQGKSVSYHPTESEFDNLIPKIAADFEKSLAAPEEWAHFQHAAVLNRLDECEAHNIPVRKLRDDKRRQHDEQVEKMRQEGERQKKENFDNRVNEVAEAIKHGKTLSVGYDESAYEGKNPVLELFKLYEIKLPLRTQGWVNTGLAELSAEGYKYYSGKGKGNSTTFGDYLVKLREKIREKPIEQLRGDNTTPDTAAKEAKKSVENNLYERFSEMFPQVLGGEYSYLRLESAGGGQPSAFEPLSMEWIGDNRLSIMHTYKMNGDLMYDPMIVFDVDRKALTMTAVEYEQSMPPIYQTVTENGNGISVDGNGRESNIKNLQSQINNFSSDWFNSISEQDYLPLRGTMEINGEDVRVEFDKDGKPILPEPEKQYDLGFGSLGYGITVWNRAEERDNDYVTVAHIDHEGKVNIYDKDMPESVRKIIENHAAVTIESKPLSVTPVPGKPTFTELDMALPDPTITAAEMNKYGYIEPDMYPLSIDRALELFDTEHPIYLLYPDNTEALAFERDEIITFGSDGLCGITEADWKMSPVYAAQMATQADAEKKRDNDFLNSGINMFAIYQISDHVQMARDFRFAPMSELDSRGLSVDRSNYKLVYTAPLSERINFPTDCYPVLNKIYEEFNISRPEDFKGHSLSVSDVIVLKYGSNISAHFVDSVGFFGIAGFYGEKSKIQENSEKTHSKLGNTSERPASSKSKPTLMEKLEENKQKAARQVQSDTHKSKEAEI